MNTRVFDANERVTVSLPAHMYNLIFLVLRKTPGLPVPYDDVHALLMELTLQTQAPQARPAEPEILQPEAGLTGAGNMRQRRQNSGNPPNA